VDSGRPLRRFPLPAEGDGVACEVLSPDGKTFAGCVGGHPVRLLDVGTGKELRQIRGGGAPAAFSADGKLLGATAAYRVVLWDVATGRQRGVLRGQAETLAFSADGSLLAWAESVGTVRVVEVATLKQRHAFAARCAALAFSADGRALATACADGTVLLWDVGGPGK
jgi:WD40 repeat protein